MIASIHDHLQHRQQRETEAAKNERAEYVLLIRKLATSPADSADLERLDALADALGIPAAVVNEDLTLVAKHRQLDARAKTIPTRRKAFQDATAAHREHEAETARIEKERHEQHRQKYIAAVNSLNALQQAEAAQFERDKLATDWPEFLGSDVVKQVAYLLPDVASIRDRHGRRISEAKNAAYDNRTDPDTVLAQVRAIENEREEELDSLTKLAGNAAKGSTVFALSRNDLDPIPSTIGCDPAMYDFQKLQGQDQDQFNALLSGVMAVYEYRAAETARILAAQRDDKPNNPA